jgi:hypothetical protein
MFKWLNKQGVESDRGFVVQSVGRFAVDYREGDKKIEVYVERGCVEGGKPAVIVEGNSFERWDGDPEWATLPLEKQDEMPTNFTEAMEFQGIAVVVPPLA